MRIFNTIKYDKNKSILNQIDCLKKQTREFNVYTYISTFSKGLNYTIYNYSPSVNLVLIT